MEIRDNSRANQFEFTEDGETGFLMYARYPGVIELIHTEVPPSMSGKGYGQALAKHALEFAKANKLRVVATCPFVRTYVKRHKEYAPLLDG